MCEFNYDEQHNKEILIIKENKTEFEIFLV